MATNKVEVTIKGISPLMMHAFPLHQPEGMDKMTPEELAEIAAYRDCDSGELYIPGVAIQRCLVQAATYSKGKGRASLQKNVAACVIVSPEKCLLGIKSYYIDARGVVIPATKGRVIRYRPRLENWIVKFDLEYDPVLMSMNEIRRVVDDGGFRVGLLEYRPEKKGPFGRFMVTEWKEID
jgi:hypothetical protein